MPLALDVKEVETIKGTQFGANIPLTEDQRKEIIFHKYINVDELLSDIQPSAPWKEQVIADIPFGSRAKPRITIGDRGITADDGIIIDLEGKPEGIYGYIDGLYRTEEETDLWEENTKKEAPRCVRWSFRITRLLKTNGPELRDRHFRTMEEKAEEEKAGMFEAVATAMRIGVQGANATGNMSPDPQKLMDTLSLEQLEKELNGRKTKK